MDSSGDGRAEEVSRRDSFGCVPRDLGQDLPEAPSRTKYDNPAVAVTVKVSEQKHRDATFKSPGVHAARDARAATTTIVIREACAVARVESGARSRARAAVRGGGGCRGRLASLSLASSSNFLRIPPIFLGAYANAGATE